MTFLSKILRGSLLIAVAGWIVASRADADIILEQYEFQGQVGGETSLPPSLVATGLGGLGVAESSGLTPSAGANSINASGWNTPGQYYSLGFTIQAGLSVTVDQIVLTSRSSGTGPGSINVQAAVDGGPKVTVATITQAGTNYNDEFLSIAPVTATRSVVFYFTPANSTSAGGGTIGSAGTFRIGDYNPSGTPTPFTLNGGITPTAVPEPAAASLMIIGLGIAGVAGRARFRAS